MAYRLVYVGLALLAVAAIAAGAAINRDGDPVELPEPLEAIFPTPGDSVIRQASVEVDLAVGYEATIYIDGVPVPNPSYEPATGVYRWAPSPASPVMTEWTPGSHTVRVEWIRVAGTPAVGHFEWSFRVN